MKAMICDRCGDFFKIENVRKGENVTDYMLVGVTTAEGVIRDKKRLDLCPGCRKSLNEWIEKFKLPGDYMDEMRKEKCSSCIFYGRPGDAPESAPLDCLYKPTEDDVDDEGFPIQEPPCEREEQDNG